MAGNRTSRRKFLELGAVGTATTMLSLHAAKETTRESTFQSGSSIVRLETDPTRPAVTFLSWDTEGGDRARTNLLRPRWPVSLRVFVQGGWLAAEGLPTKKEGIGSNGIRYVIDVGIGAELVWEILPANGKLDLVLAARGMGIRRIEAVEILFPFDPQVTPTSVLPSRWIEDDGFRLPAIITAPDFGQMLLTEENQANLTGRLRGDRARQTVTIVLEIPGSDLGKRCMLRLMPVYLAAPNELSDADLWRHMRRGWWNIWQPSASWEKQSGSKKWPAGLLANNVISDPVSTPVFFYADFALWTPVLAPGISIMDHIRSTVEYWLTKGIMPNGKVMALPGQDWYDAPDSNASPVIAAWDYIEATDDQQWLEQNIGALENVADYLARLDVDNDGLIEAVQSGNAGTLVEPKRACAWWDAINCGHKDSYTNALTYRAWRCLAELEGKLGRTSQQKRYRQLANRLKRAYVRVLYNPATGWLGWWRSADGELHDFASPVVNGLAIEYGLVEQAQGRDILLRLWRKMDNVGFRRFDLGIPPMLVPVPRRDYLVPDGFGVPMREDGSDTFGYYMNGGIAPGRVLHFILAHYVVGMPEQAHRILRAMVGRQQNGGFHNGVVDRYPYGADWTTWDGRPAGYEGYLSDMFYFLLAGVLRDRALRMRHYRPLAEAS
jgi:Bacterial alpha-L-rhamnosidase 6 hairpin glycosidase domain